MELPHNPTTCSDPSGWRPDRCTCEVKILRETIAALDELTTRGERLVRDLEAPTRLRGIAVVGSFRDSLERARAVLTKVGLD